MLEQFCGFWGQDAISRGKQGVASINMKMSCTLQSKLPDEQSISIYFITICDRESFHLFVASADGLLAPAATKLLQHLAALTADCQQLPFSTAMKHL